MSLDRKRAIRRLSAAAMLAGGFLLFASRAFAGEFVKIGTIGPFAEESPRSVAVDTATGDLYALNNGAGRVEEFRANGEPLGESFNGSETPAGAFSSVAVGVAVDNGPSSPNKGDVYVVDRENDVVDRFSAAGKYLGQLSGFVGPEETNAEPDSVAVDANGDVYVSVLLTNVVREFAPDGSPIGEITGLDIEKPFGVAIGPSGEVYVVNNKNNMAKIGLNAKHEVESETIFDTGEEPTAVAVEPSTGDVLVVNNNGGAHVVVFSPSGKLEGEFGGGQLGASRGIAFSSASDDIYLADKGNDLIDIYEVPPPSTVTGPATAVGRTSATLNGTINPEGVEAKFYFEYGPCASPSNCAGSHFPSKTVEGVVGAAKEVTSVPVEERLVNELAPGTTYHARLVKVGEVEPEAGREIVFVTSSAVAGLSICAGRETGEGSLVDAKLEASLEPEGEAAEYYFEYGLTTLYTEPHTSSTPTSSIGIQRAGAEVTMLEPNATYDCRLAAVREIGGIAYAAHGENGIFTTRAVAPMVDDRPPSVSKITRTTAVLTGTINPEHGATRYHFVYVMAADYEAAAKNPYYAGASTPEAAAGEGFGDEDVSSQLRGLHAGTTYDYALVAEGEATGPVVVVGRNHQFTTAPPIVPQVGPCETAAVTQTSATILDTINPENLPTTYELDLGTDVNVSGTRLFGQVVEGDETIAVDLEGLAPGTTYFVKVRATNEDGTAEGPVDQMFTTPGVISPIAGPKATPLLTTPTIAFPTEQGEVIKAPSKKKSGRTGKRHASPKRKRKVRERTGGRQRR